jgi:hypothetical protein
VEPQQLLAHTVPRLATAARQRQRRPPRPLRPLPAGQVGDSRQRPPRDNFSIVVRSKDIPQGHYLGSNAMGAKVRVAKDTETTLAITVNGDSLALVRHPLLVPVEPSVAPKIKSLLGFLCVGRLATSSPDVAKTVVIHIDPGIDHPLERTLVYHYLASKQVEVWTYNKATGRILQKNVIDSHEYGEAPSSVNARAPETTAPPPSDQRRFNPECRPRSPTIFLRQGRPGVLVPRR